MSETKHKVEKGGEVIRLEQNKGGDLKIIANWDERG